MPQSMRLHISNIYIYLLNPKQQLDDWTDIKCYTQQ